jgi:hypothetical protein
MKRQNSTLLNLVAEHWPILVLLIGFVASATCYSSSASFLLISSLLVTLTAFGYEDAFVFMVQEKPRGARVS